MIETKVFDIIAQHQAQPLSEWIKPDRSRLLSDEAIAVPLFDTAKVNAQGSQVTLDFLTYQDPAVADLVPLLAKHFEAQSKLNDAPFLFSDFIERVEIVPFFNADHTTLVAVGPDSLITSGRAYYFRDLDHCMRPRVFQIGEKAPYPDIKAAVKALIKADQHSRALTAKVNLLVFHSLCGIIQLNQSPELLMKTLNAIAFLLSVFAANVSAASSVSFDNRNFNAVKGQPFTVLLKRSNSVGAASVHVATNFVISDHSALPDQNFKDQIIAVSFADGQLRASFTVQIFDDGVQEANKIFALSLFMAEGVQVNERHRERLVTIVTN